MAEQLKIFYAYRFEDGTTLKFDLHLDRDTLALTMENPEELPDWAILTQSQCSLCPLDEDVHSYCPVAANLAEVVEKFSKFVSHDKVGVACVVEERTYSKNTTVQMGLSPLLGIIMTTSGCPVLEQLKPMVRFHLPFATLEETIFRMVSMHFVAQYLRQKEGKTPDWTLETLTNIYAEVAQVNQDFSERLLKAARNDVNVNALVNLDAFAKMVPLAADSMLKKIAPHFSALLK